MMPISESEELFERGVRAVDTGNWLSALAYFEKAVQIENRPVYNSYLAACIAKERGQYNKAVTLCREAIEMEPENSAHHLNLGRIYLLQGLKKEAMKAFREGLRHDREERIIRELDSLGTRKSPVIRFLKRDNPVNKYIGILLSKMRLR
jgi:tetratricopeptide (TPR) repeat protein